MLETVPPIISQEHFIRALLTAYKEHSILWDKNHPQYRNRTERSKALQELIEISRRYTPEADEDFVKVKVDSLRSTFRREWRKVCLSKTKATESEDVYKPTLWYYNLLLFTVGGESEENNEKCDDSVDTPKTSWNREYTAILIGLLKKHPCLYVNASNSALWKRKAAYRKITDEMNTYTEKSFNVHEIRKKILLLKDQYRHEFKKAREKRRMYPEGPYNSNLWCFEMLSFLRGHVLKKRSKEEPKRTLKKICRNKRESADSLTVEESLVIKEEAASDQVLFEKSINKMHSSDVTNCLNADDIFDTIGNNVARKLRDMTNDQQKYAIVLVNDVMYHGFMENLSCSSRLSVDGT